MALTLILCFIIVVQLFSESTCTHDTVYNVKPVCGDLSLQYVFFLVPSSSDFPNLTKFLSTIESATILKTPENEGGMVRILCDPKDWKKIYEYSKNRDIYFLHLASCEEKSEYSTLQELRPRGNKLRKSTMNKWLNNYLDREYKTESRKNTRVRKSLKEFNTDVSTVLKNVRILKTRAVNPGTNKNREAGKSQTTQSPSTKIPSRKSSSKNTSKKNKPSPKETSRKSGKKVTTKNENKTFTRRSIESEIEGSNWLERSFRRIKRYSWDLLMKNDNAQIRERRSGKKSSSSEPASGRGKIVSTTPSLRELNETETTTELSELDNNSTLRSFQDGEKETITTTNNVTVTDSSKRIDETSSQLSNNATENSSGPTITRGSERAGEIHCEKDRDDDDDDEHHHHHRHHHGSKGTDKDMRLGKDANTRRLSAPGGNAVTAAIVEPVKSKETVSAEKQGPVSTSAKKVDCFSEGTRDSDHSKLDSDIDCLGVEPDSLGELANYLQSIFEWVKNLEYRVKAMG